MSGKKTDKFRITLGFACNADGSERLPIFYIGKSKQPHCFKKKSPKDRGFYYRNNKTAWMTAELFEEYVPASHKEIKSHENKVDQITGPAFQETESEDNSSYRQLFRP
jgi:hypothetical protein